MILTAALVLLAGCSTTTPRYGYDGVYGDGSVQPAWSAAGYSALYPYWSLDHFYFSRYYLPYSVVVHAYDPWLYPYSAWYWGYPYTHPRFFSLSWRWAYDYRAPWDRHRVWRPSPNEPLFDYRDRRMSDGQGLSRPRGSFPPDRIERFERQRAQRDSGGSLMGQSPPPRRSSPPPVNRRAPPTTNRPSVPNRRPSRAPERIREQPP
ncbi:hypothetical protein [Wenzhouxiangella marina]|uniref:Uncharacterized protein n=1 Tax=Wenzhouxiangella marina TaxID=1579979 RepID=A0A0K0XYV2_9GAMM|nr:hypothetical protein [Wenzhouxiangella marina]AKS42850.1 hypothetical protein WM2015_2492 [Wenzhouxiangella marina]MBB6087468.1 hypothetical protein [Wenzhouxiangella marina]